MSFLLDFLQVWYMRDTVEKARFFGKNTGMCIM